MFIPELPHCPQKNMGEKNKILWEIEKNMGKIWEIEKNMGNALKMLKNAF